MNAIEFVNENGSFSGSTLCVNLAMIHVAKKKSKQ